MTSRTPVVVIVTSRKDVPADMVVRLLGGDGFPVDVHRVDPADIETGYLKLRAVLRQGRCTFTLSDPHRTTESDRIAAIWWRKPMTTTSNEGHAQLEGLLRTLDGVRWLNHPDINTKAAHKPVQLLRAHQAGLRVPETVLPAGSQSLASVFSASHAAGAVAKTLAIKGGVTWVTGDWESSLAAGPIALQERVAKDYDVRVTAVDGKLFAATVTPPNGEVDWRRVQEDCVYWPIAVPEDVARGISIYLEMQNLTYGAFDFAVDGEGQWWFLECNPNGQSAFIEIRTGLPIAQALAETLAVAPS
jgi:hypothetical protein